MGRDDFYASAYGAVYSAYMQRPWLARPIGRVVWGGDAARYYESMRSIGECPSGATVLDCPCGAGAAFGAIPPGREIRYLALDLSPAMLRRARKRAAKRGLDEVGFLQADAAELPLEADSVDLYLSYWGLHCFEDPAAALAEAARVLVSEGRLVGATFVREGTGLRQRFLIRPGNGDFGRLGSEVEVRGWLEEAGFAILASDRSGPMFFFEARRR